MPKYAYFGIHIHSNFFYRCLRDVLSTGNAESQLPPKGVGVGFIHTSKKVFQISQPQPQPQPQQKKSDQPQPQHQLHCRSKILFFYNICI